MSLEMLAGGLATSVQDLGRPGWQAQGVGAAGALDADCLRLANALVGNAAEAAGLEITLRGPCLRFTRAGAFALCGAPFELTLDGVPCDPWRCHPAHAGQVLAVGRALRGARAWLALAGGIDLPPLLHSRSSDLNSALGPLPRTLRAGDTLPLGTAARLPPASPARWSLDPAPWFAEAGGVPLRLLPGAHYARLSQHARAALYGSVFTVAAQSSRAGLRLDGTRLDLVQPLECVSSGCVPGVLQLPPGGQPILLLAEHPVSGGYPRIAQAAAVDLPRLAQAVPGTALRFAAVDMDTATRLLLARRTARTQLEARIRARLEPT